MLGMWAWLLWAVPGRVTQAPQRTVSVLQPVCEPGNPHSSTPVIILTFQPSPQRLQRKQTLGQEHVSQGQGLEWGSEVAVVQNLRRHPLSLLFKCRIGSESERLLKSWVLRLCCLTLSPFSCHVSWEAGCCTLMSRCIWVGIPLSVSKTVSPSVKCP